MKTYYGKRTSSGLSVRVDGHDLCPCHHIRNHSPDGFECGYGGSGPAQLALALCYDVLRDEVRAVRVYQSVKWTLVAAITAETFEITDEQVLEHIAHAEGKTEPPVKFPATRTINWMTGPVYCCTSHADKLVGMARFLGAKVGDLDSAPPGSQCSNCVNESENETGRKV